MKSRASSAIIVFDHPCQHYTRAFQLLCEYSPTPTEVWYWRSNAREFDPDFNRPVRWDADLLAGYAWRAPAADASPQQRAVWLHHHFRRNRPGLVICFGWATPIARLTLAYCILAGVPVLMFSDASWQSSGSGKKIKDAVRSLVLAVLFRRCAGAISTGVFNREFYIAHGMRPDRVFAGVCPGETEEFGAARLPHFDQPQESASIRIGFAGKLIWQKGADILLRAASLLPGDLAWSISIIGDGPMIGELVALRDQLNLADRVRFSGFANTSQMPALLADLDVVVVPSRRDLRVVVTTEAMAAGAAVVVSDATAVWGAGDLVQHGVTGLVFRSEDPADLSQNLLRLLKDRQLLADLRRQGSQHCEKFSSRQFALTTAAAIRSYIRADRLTSVKNSPEPETAPN